MPLSDFTKEVTSYHDLVYLGESISYLRMISQAWLERLANELGIDSLAFRKIYDVEQRIANAQHDIFTLLDILEKNKNLSFLGDLNAPS